jgi:hypothetical protein
MIIHCPQARVGGRVRAQVIEPLAKRDLSRRGVTPVNRDGVMCLGRIVYTSPWTHNLVTDYGLNRYCTTADFYQQMTYACAGFDGTGTEISTTSNVSQAGTTVTAASPGTFGAGDVGKVIAWDSDPNGTQTYITVFTDTQTVTVAKSQSVSAGAAKLYNVAQAGLISERSGANSNTPLRSNSYLVGSNGTTHVLGSSDYLYWRTYDFSSQTADVVYREVGVSDLSTVGANLFSRIRLSGDVNVLTGQQLRLTYEMLVSIGPVVPTASAPVITGWGTVNGGQVLVRGVMATIGSAGNSVTSSDEPNAGCLAPFITTTGEALNVWASAESAALGNYQGGYSFRSSGAVMAGTTSLLSYTPGNFYRDLRGTFTPAQGAFTCRSMGFGRRRGAFPNPFEPWDSGQVFTFLADADQAKADTHQLVLNFRRSGGRLLA